MINLTAGALVVAVNLAMIFLSGRPARRTRQAA